MDEEERDDQPIAEMQLGEEDEETRDERQQNEVDEEEEQTVREQVLAAENKRLKQQVKNGSFGIQTIEADDKLTGFYTGLPTWPVFLHLFLFLNVSNASSLSRLSPENELFLALVRLRLGLLYEDLSVHFNVCLSVVTRTVKKWIDLTYIRLSFLIAWPGQDVCRRNLPTVFKETYPRCRCIIDCSEIFIETPTNFTAKAQTYSNYKKHNTLKFLIGVTPFGTISFLSQCWDGQVSDKNLTQSSGFFNKIERGDTILADRGFTIAEDFAVFGAKLEIPSFTRGKQQLSQREVEMSKQLSRIRIHVERVIGLLKNKYLILKGPLSISILKHKGDKNVANIDKAI